MANIKKSLKKLDKPKQSRVQDTEDTLLADVQAMLVSSLPTQSNLLLALSGGLDSIVLLHLLTKIKQTIPFNLHAMHVHHGLSHNADYWARFCKDQCHLLHVDLETVYVDVNVTKTGTEAAARKLRYEALFSFKLNSSLPDFIVTAHHLDDQAETLLLQLFRGAGVKGLASMAMVDNRRRLLRPLLNASRASILNYAVTNDLTWCEDESNLDCEYDRNFVRHKVLPLVRSRYSAIPTTLGRTAEHLAEAEYLLNTLASLDAKSLLIENSLCLRGLSQLDDRRIKNVLRWWFANNALLMPSAVYLDEIARQLLHAKQDSTISIKLKPLTLKRYQQRAYLVRSNVNAPFEAVWMGEERLHLPDGNVLLFEQKMGTGMALRLLNEDLKISNLSYPKTFKTNALRPTKTLKHLFMEINMPPWQRKEVPLIYLGDKLVYIPNIGALHTMSAGQDELGLVVNWRSANTC